MLGYILKSLAVIEHGICRINPCLCQPDLVRRRHLLGKEHNVRNLYKAIGTYGCRVFSIHLVSLIIYETGIDKITFGHQVAVTAILFPERAQCVELQRLGLSHLQFEVDIHRQILLHTLSLACKIVVVLVESILELGACNLFPINAH